MPDMTGFAEDELIPALYTLLSGDADLSALHVQVFDHVPQGVAKPFITIDSVASADDGTKTSPGESVVVDISTWTEYKGKKEVNLITRRVHMALHEKPLNLTNFTVSTMRVDTVVTQQSPDTLTYSSTVRVRCLCRAKSQ